MSDDIVNKLQTLCHPASEFLSDGKRLDLLIQRGKEAADEIVRLRGEVERLTRNWSEAITANSNLASIHFEEEASLRCERDAAFARAEAAERERDWHKSLTQSHDLIADNAAQKTRAEAAEAKVAKLRAALTETLAVAARNEEGRFADRARAILKETEQ